MVCREAGSGELPAFLMSGYANACCGLTLTTRALESHMRAKRRGWGNPIPFLSCELVHSLPCLLDHGSDTVLVGATGVEKALL